MHQAIPGEPVIDQIPVYEDDGYTKHSGLTASDFVVNVWANGNPMPTAVSIVEEDASGEYILGFVPTVNGFWKVEILNTYNYDIWFVEVEVRATDVVGLEDLLHQIMDGDTGLFVPTDSLHSQKLDIIRILGLLHHNAIVDNQEYDTNSQLIRARVRVFDTKAHVPATSGGSETLGLLHIYTLEASYAGLNIVTMYKLLREQ